MATENKAKPNTATAKGKKRKQFLPYNVSPQIQTLFYSTLHSIFIYSLYFTFSFLFLWKQKAVKKRGAYPLRPGVQGFFITCDGGRERQAAHEAINVIDSVCFFVPFFKIFSIFFLFYKLLLIFIRVIIIVNIQSYFLSSKSIYLLKLVFRFLLCSSFSISKLYIA